MGDVGRLSIPLGSSSSGVKVIVARCMSTAGSVDVSEKGTARKKLPSAELHLALWAGVKAELESSVILISALACSSVWGAQNDLRIFDATTSTKNFCYFIKIIKLKFSLPNNRRCLIINPIFKVLFVYLPSPCSSYDFCARILSLRRI